MITSFFFITFGSGYVESEEFELCHCNVIVCHSKITDNKTNKYLTECDHDVIWQGEVVTSST